jgi:hypothetical protein
MMVFGGILSWLNYSMVLPAVMILIGLYIWREKVLMRSNVETQVWENAACFLLSNKYG